MPYDPNNSAKDFAGRIVRQWGLRAGVALVALVTIRSSMFNIDQTELGFVRRFGTVVGDTTKPLEPGLHFKIPFVETADKIPVTLKTLHVPEFKVLTIDNQEITVEENFNYTIPKKNVYHLMYEVGGSGNVDITDQVVPVVKDRTSRVLAAQNMITVNANREAIQAQIEKNIVSSTETLFGIEAHSLQIAKLDPSPAFKASIDSATQAKNDAVKAENVLRTKQFEAQQTAAIAKGNADAAIEAARGQAESVMLNAKAQADATVLTATANKTSLELQGKGEEARLAAEISAFGGNPDKYNEYLRAKASLNWRGDVPSVETGSGGGPNLVLPLPAAAGRR